jgi:hypothetical protein
LGSETGWARKTGCPERLQSPTAELARKDAPRGHRDDASDGRQCLCRTSPAQSQSARLLEPTDSFAPRRNWPARVARPAKGSSGANHEPAARRDPLGSTRRVSPRPAALGRPTGARVRRRSRLCRCAALAGPNGARVCRRSRLCRCAALGTHDRLGGTSLVSPRRAAFGTTAAARARWRSRHHHRARRAWRENSRGHLPDRPGDASLGRPEKDPPGVALAVVQRFARAPTGGERGQRGRGGQGGGHPPKAQAAGVHAGAWRRGRGRRVLSLSPAAPSRRRRREKDRRDAPLCRRPLGWGGASGPRQNRRDPGKRRTQHASALRRERQWPVCASRREQWAVCASRREQWAVCASRRNCPGHRGRRLSRHQAQRAQGGDRPLSGERLGAGAGRPCSPRRRARGRGQVRRTRGGDARTTTRRTYQRSGPAGRRSHARARCSE